MKNKLQQIASRGPASDTDEATRKALTYARAEAARPRNGQRFPFAKGLSIGECLDAYHAEHVHRRKASTYYVTETLNQFLAVNNIEENFPIIALEKYHSKVYKTALLNGSLTPRGRRKPGPITIARKLSTPAKLVSSSRVQKEGFTDEELSRLFSGLVPFKVHRDPVMKEWYWAILMLAHSGCRATEVVQLLRSDIAQVEGIWFFNVVGTGEGRQLKNRASVRQVPIHSNLMKAGFLEWYQAQTDKRLFPLLFPYGVVKTTMTFTRLLRKLKLKRPSVTLHSLRHAMTVKLKRARVHYSLMRRLLGHSVGKAVEDRVYLGSLKYSVKEMSEALESVSYPGGG